MSNALLGLYQVFSVTFYVALSAVLLYRRLLRRWLRFSAGFFLVYVAGAYVFFGVLALPFLGNAGKWAGIVRCVLDGVRGSTDYGAWLALSSLVVPVFAVGFVVGHMLLARRHTRELLGGVLVLLIVAAFFLVVVEATVGYDRLGTEWRRCSWFPPENRAVATCFSCFREAEGEGRGGSGNTEGSCSAVCRAGFKRLSRGSGC